MDDEWSKPYRGEKNASSVDDHLIELQIKNRILKRLKNKTTKEIELEKLEKGFSIYLNGANAETSRKQHKISKHKVVSSKPVWKPIWPADASRSAHQLTEDRCNPEQDNTKRSQTAPGNVHRKEWVQKPIRIRTEEGPSLLIFPQKPRSESKDMESSSSSRPCSSQSHLDSAELIVLDFGPSRKERMPGRILSARRRETFDTQDPEETACSVREAIQRENDLIKTHELFSRSKDRGHQSGNGSLNHNSDEKDENRVALAMNRITYMGSREQQKLLKALEKLDAEPRYSITQSVTTDYCKQWRKQSAAEVTTAIYVTMEILSNWGNALQVGLTELQFFCLRNKKLYVSPHDLDIRNADYPGNLAALVNGKAKTTKEHHMWTCPFHPPVQLYFIVRNTEHSPDFGLSHIKIWNYNRSIHDLDVGARHIKLYLNSTLVFEGELGKGCGNQVFDYSTTIDLKDFQLLDSLFSSPVSSRHNLGSASSQCIETKNGVDVGSPHLSNLQSLESTGQTMMDMEERSRTLLPPIISSPGAVSSSTRRSSIQRSSFDLIASEEPLSLRQQVEQFAPLEQTVTTQPSSRVAPQWLQPLNRGVPEGCEASREKPRWLVPQNSAEPKSSSSSASMLPDLPCNPGRVCRGVEKSVNGGPWKANSLDLGCDLLEDLKGEPKPDRPISGRRSSFRNAAVPSRPSEEQHLRTAALSNAEEPLSLVLNSRQCSSMAKLHSQQDETLRESWDSLSKFNQCQRGRISNMSLDWGHL
ncbi:hypothetical protein fugu_001049 [Takifugu bimaculatus]|uniref:KATNIP domain-containing protein n=1 Tax=Takifugu bimaculatus TaxID=433685 RepID=A0A4Z2CIU9_9TELE|nr:hypothetical protein fugu_001049 [Takifugu bimaculatus]